MQSAFAVSLLVFVCAQLARANVFLAKGMGRETEMLNESTVKERLLEEVYGFMGRGTVDLQLPAIKRRPLRYQSIHTGSPVTQVAFSIARKHAELVRSFPAGPCLRPACQRQCLPGEGYGSRDRDAK
eukprot:TRINITY_DN20147_c0_g1_i1.p1 TRINITY_DN20147_c0_g1~~TRINITY_DN20147_c0_g1_i1.p1  ORF type:complete len:127 (+),score=9.64 TRINITY_DN20147_c0_g1_i1:149-529(+)